MLSLVSLFCHVDDFCRWFEPQVLIPFVPTQLELTL